MSKLYRNLFSFLIVGIICYAGLIFLGERGGFRDAILSFPVHYFPLLLILTFVNYLLRFFRWQIYLKNLNVQLSAWRSFQVFMAGQAMILTPAKSGEVLKGHLLRPEIDDAWSVAIPAVFAERLTDLMGVVLLTFAGLSVMPMGKHVALLGVAACAVLFLAFSRPVFFTSFCRMLARIPVLKKVSEKLLYLYPNIQSLLSLRLMVVTLLLSALAWFVEGLVLYFSLIACGSGINVVEATFTYSLSSLIGALSMIPGGLVLTEGSISGILYLYGVPLDLASVVTVVVRICTLWFPVFMGIGFVLFLQRRHVVRKQAFSK